ncbi:MAG: hypothetical protein COS98_01750, partial [Parcubacteria group bacterium CG07_land_8_20_14_0_80_35_11]
KKEGQSALIGGGRYDYLINQMGGKDTPAIGGAGGVERIIEEIREQKINILAKRVERFEKKPKMFLAQLGELAKEKSLTLLEEFRKNKIIIGENVGKDNLKVQLEQAAKLGVKYTLILGQREALEDTVIIRNMETGIQEIVFIKDIVKEIKKKVK